MQVQRSCEHIARNSGGHADRIGHGRCDQSRTQASVAGHIHVIELGENLDDGLLGTHESLGYEHELGGQLFHRKKGGREMTLVYKAKEATCLVPVSAVHGSGDDRYVYTVETRSGSFGSSEMTVRKMSVQVEAEVEGVASLSEDISWYTLAYMEDRAISDGDRVMEYTQ